MTKSSITLDDMKINVPKRKVILGNSVIQVVKLILNVLDTTWLIIKEFKYKMERERHVHLDIYYTRIVDALLLKVKILHLSVLIATYDNAPFIQALESLSQLLKAKSTEAEKKLEEINQQLKEYNDTGPEFETLKEVYKSLIHKIQATKDDINRIQNN
ncbi:hypothetical protein BD770DRAFT_14318 [Pilaira anomala]|nr:hypothetical protein BD770DRAFT_14318 [Pilaira anomala]